MTARARMNEMAKAFARRVVEALLGQDPDATGRVADWIMDGLHEIQVITVGEVRDMKRVRLVLEVSGAVAQSILRAAAMPDPAPDPAPAVDPGCPGCGSTASVHICPNAPEVQGLKYHGSITLPDDALPDANERAIQRGLGE